MNDWAAWKLPEQSPTVEELMLKRSEIALKHMRDYTTNVRDFENIVSKRHIYGNAQPLNWKNLQRHNMKMARVGSSFSGNTCERRDRLYNVRKDTVADCFCFSDSLCSLGYISHDITRNHI